MAQPLKANEPRPTPQQLNRITAQLRELNKAYRAAVANGKGTAGGPEAPKTNKQSRPHPCRPTSAGGLVPAPGA
ncbi:MAG: hypothetical protein JW767_10215 [Thermoleophilia bacterium]|nr:hypothetical protein [Thermoleophilia bacterium]